MGIIETSLLEKTTPPVIYVWDTYYKFITGSTMSDSNHDTLVYRLEQMLIKFNQGKKLDPHELADEFHVNIRTIQRDLNERFAYLPLEKNEGRYSLDPTFLGKLSTKDIERFLGLLRDISIRMHTLNILAGIIEKRTYEFIRTLSLFFDHDFYITSRLFPIIK